MNNIKLIKQLGRDEALLQYLKEVNTLWDEGKISIDELTLRLAVVEEMEQSWEEAEKQELEDNGSIYDQYPEYFTEQESTNG